MTSPVWPAGFHWAGPWTQVSNLVTKQFIVFETPIKGCKTADNVTVGIDMCLIFRIMGDASKGKTRTWCAALCTSWVRMDWRFSFEQHRTKLCVRWREVFNTLKCISFETVRCRKLQHRQACHAQP